MGATYNEADHSYTDRTGPAVHHRHRRAGVRAAAPTPRDGAGLVTVPGPGTRPTIPVGYGPAPARYVEGGPHLSPQRARVLDDLQLAQAAVTVEETATRLALHTNTARNHLEALVEAGLATREQAPVVGRGRPAWSYTAAEGHPEADVRVRDYAGLATALAGQISRTSADPAGDALAAGQAWGRSLVEGQPVGTAAQARRRVVELFDRLGFAPETRPAQHDRTAAALPAARRRPGQPRGRVQRAPRDRARRPRGAGWRPGADQSRGVRRTRGVPPRPGTTFAEGTEHDREDVPPMSSKDASGSNGAYRGRGAAGLDDPLTEALVDTRRFFTRAEVSDDLRAMHRVGRAAGRRLLPRPVEPRQGRALHPRRQLHRVVLVEGLRQGRHHHLGVAADRLPVGRAGPPGVRAARLPARRRLLLVHLLAHPGALPVRARRAARDVPRGQGARSATRSLAWADIVDDPEKSRRYKAARGKGGLVRADVGGGGRDRRGRPRATRSSGTAPTGSPASRRSPRCRWSRTPPAPGSSSLIGGSMLSFYDWYADLPVASPQVFGDQTDVPESGDWWDAGYLIMWGSNVPVTRTPDAHWMTEARYRGQKVVAVSPDYADNVKFADEWLAAQPGTDGALAMAMGHVILKEFFVDRQVALLHRLRQEVHRPAVPGPLERARRQLRRRASSSPPPTSTATQRRRERRRSRRCCSTPRPASRWSRTARSASGYGDEGAGKWNLDLGEVDPLLTAARRPREPGRRSRCRASTPATARPRVLRRGVPVRRVGGRLVTTVFDLLLAQYGVRRHGLPGHLADRLRRRRPSRTRRPGRRRSPACPRRQAERIGREFAANAEESQRPVDDPDGRRHQPLVPLRHDLPRVPRAHHAHRLPGRQRRRLGALRRPGEVPPGHRLGAAGVRRWTGRGRRGR